MALWRCPLVHSMWRASVQKYRRFHRRSYVQQYHARPPRHQLLLGIRESQWLQAPEHDRMVCDDDGRFEVDCLVCDSFRKFDGKEGDVLLACPVQLREADRSRILPRQIAKLGANWASRSPTHPRKSTKAPHTSTIGNNAVSKQ
jgi:hypothetical protein